MENNLIDNDVKPQETLNQNGHLPASTENQRPNSPTNENDEGWDKSPLGTPSADANSDGNCGEVSETKTNKEKLTIVTKPVKEYFDGNGAKEKKPSELVDKEDVKDLPEESLDIIEKEADIVLGNEAQAAIAADDAIPPTRTHESSTDDTISNENGPFDEATAKVGSISAAKQSQLDMSILSTPHRLKIKEQLEQGDSNQIKRLSVSNIDCLNKVDGITPLSTRSRSLCLMPSIEEGIEEDRVCAHIPQSSTSSSCSSLVSSPGLRCRHDTVQRVSSKPTLMSISEELLCKPDSLLKASPPKAKDDTVAQGVSWNKFQKDGHQSSADQGKGDTFLDSSAEHGGAGSEGDPTFGVDKHNQATAYFPGGEGLAADDKFYDDWVILDGSSSSFCPRSDYEIIVGRCTGTKDANQSGEIHSGVVTESRVQENGLEEEEEETSVERPMPEIHPLMTSNVNTREYADVREISAYAGFHEGESDVSGSEGPGSHADSSGLAVETLSNAITTNGHESAEVEAPEEVCRTANVFAHSEADAYMPDEMKRNSRSRADSRADNGVLSKGVDATEVDSPLADQDAKVTLSPKAKGSGSDSMVTECAGGGIDQASPRESHSEHTTPDKVDKDYKDKDNPKQRGDKEKERDRDVGKRKRDSRDRNKEESERKECLKNAIGDVRGLMIEQIYRGNLRELRSQDVKSTCRLQSQMVENADENTQPDFNQQPFNLEELSGMGGMGQETGHENDLSFESSKQQTRIGKRKCIKKVRSDDSTNMEQTPSEGINSETPAEEALLNCSEALSISMISSVNSFRQDVVISEGLTDSQPDSMKTSGHRMRLLPRQVKDTSFNHPSSLRSEEQDRVPLPGESFSFDDDSSGHLAVAQSSLPDSLEIPVTSSDVNAEEDFSEISVPELSHAEDGIGGATSKRSNEAGTHSDESTHAFPTQERERDEGASASGYNQCVVETIKIMQPREAIEMENGGQRNVSDLSILPHSLNCIGSTKASDIQLRIERRDTLSPCVEEVGESQTDSTNSEVLKTFLSMQNQTDRGKYLEETDRSDEHALNLKEAKSVDDIDSLHLNEVADDREPIALQGENWTPANQSFKEICESEGGKNDPIFRTLNETMPDEISGKKQFNMFPLDNDHLSSNTEDSISSARDNDLPASGQNEPEIFDIEIDNSESESAECKFIDSPVKEEEKSVVERKITENEEETTPHKVFISRCHPLENEFIEHAKFDKVRIPEQNQKDFNSHKDNDENLHNSETANIPERETCPHEDSDGIVEQTTIENANTMEQDTDFVFPVENCDVVEQVNAENVNILKQTQEVSSEEEQYEIEQSNLKHADIHEHTEETSPEENAFVQEDNYAIVQEDNLENVSFPDQIKECPYDAEYVIEEKTEFDNADIPEKTKECPSPKEERSITEQTAFENANIEQGQNFPSTEEERNTDGEANLGNTNTLEKTKEFSPPKEEYDIIEEAGVERVNIELREEFSSLCKERDIDCEYNFKTANVLEATKESPYPQEDYDADGEASFKNASILEHNPESYSPNEKHAEQDNFENNIQEQVIIKQENMSDNEYNDQQENIPLKDESQEQGFHHSIGDERNTPKEEDFDTDQKVVDGENDNSLRVVVEQEGRSESMQETNLDEDEKKQSRGDAVMSETPKERTYSPHRNDINDEEIFGFEQSLSQTKVHEEEHVVRSDELVIGQPEENHIDVKVLHAMEPSEMVQDTEYEFMENCMQKEKIPESTQNNGDNNLENYMLEESMKRTQKEDSNDIEIHSDPHGNLELQLKEEEMDREEGDIETKEKQESVGVMDNIHADVSGEESNEIREEPEEGAKVLIDGFMDGENQSEGFHDVNVDKMVVFQVNEEEYVHGGEPDKVEHDIKQDIEEIPIIQPGDFEDQDEVGQVSYDEDVDEIMEKNECKEKSESPLGVNIEAIEENKDKKLLTGDALVEDSSERQLGAGVDESVERHTSVEAEAINQQEGNQPAVNTQDDVDKDDGYQVNKFMATDVISGDKEMVYQSWSKTESAIGHDEAEREDASRNEVDSVCEYENKGTSDGENLKIKNNKEGSCVESVSLDKVSAEEQLEREASVGKVCQDIHNDSHEGKYAKQDSNFDIQNSWVEDSGSLEAEDSSHLKRGYLQCGEEKEKNEVEVSQESVPDDAPLEGWQDDVDNKLEANSDSFGVIETEIVERYPQSNASLDYPYPGDFTDIADAEDGLKRTTSNNTFKSNNVDSQISPKKQNMSSSDNFEENEELQINETGIIAVPSDELVNGDKETVHLLEDPSESLVAPPNMEQNQEGEIKQEILNMNYLVERSNSQDGYLCKAKVNDTIPITAAEDLFGITQEQKSPCESTKSSSTESQSKDVTEEEHSEERNSQIQCRKFPVTEEGGHAGQDELPVYKSEYNIQLSNGLNDAKTESDTVDVSEDDPITSQALASLPLTDLCRPVEGSVSASENQTIQERSTEQALYGSASPQPGELLASKNCCELQNEFDEGLQKSQSNSIVEDSDSSSTRLRLEVEVHKPFSDSKPPMADIKDNGDEKDGEPHLTLAAKAIENPTVMMVHLMEGQGPQLKSNVENDLLHGGEKDGQHIQTDLADKDDISATMSRSGCGEYFHSPACRPKVGHDVIPNENAELRSLNEEKENEIKVADIQDDQTVKLILMQPTIEDDCPVKRKIAYENIRESCTLIDNDSMKEHSILDIRDENEFEDNDTDKNTLDESPVSDEFPDNRSTQRVERDYGIERITDPNEKLKKSSSQTHAENSDGITIEKIISEDKLLSRVIPDNKSSTLPLKHLKDKPSVGGLSHSRTGAEEKLSKSCSNLSAEDAPKQGKVQSGITITTALPRTNKLPKKDTLWGKFLSKLKPSVLMDSQPADDVEASGQAQGQGAALTAWQRPPHPKSHRLRHKSITRRKHVRKLRKLEATRYSAERMVREKQPALRRHVMGKKSWLPLNGERLALRKPKKQGADGKDGVKASGRQADVKPGKDGDKSQDKMVEVSCEPGWNNATASKPIISKDTSAVQLLMQPLMAGMTSEQKQEVASRSQSPEKTGGTRKHVIDEASALKTRPSKRLGCAVM